MSYARLSEDCGVYVYLSCDRYLCCGLCSIPDAYNAPGHMMSHAAYSTAEMLAHLDRHRERGDIVPDYLPEELLADAEENDAWLVHGIGEGA